MWIFHVDRHSEFAAAFRTLLEARGHVVASVSCADIGEHRSAQRELFDVVVLEVDGLLADEVDDLRIAIPRVPIVGLTRLGSPDALRRVEGLDGLILKVDPVDEAIDVMSKVIALLSRPGRNRTVWSAGVRRVILTETPIAV